MPLHPTNWRPLLLCSLLVAQKVEILVKMILFFGLQVWDDKYLSNADFAFIYPFFVTEEINKLEQKFLELLQFFFIISRNINKFYLFFIDITSP